MVNARWHTTFKVHSSLIAHRLVCIKLFYNFYLCIHFKYIVDFSTGEKISACAMYVLFPCMIALLISNLMGILASQIMELLRGCM